jgi:cobalt transporter subunit CbtA
MIFRNLVFASMLVGIVSGVVLALVQQVAVTPTIIAAEQFEGADEESVVVAPALIEQPVHGHDHGHHHEHEDSLGTNFQENGHHQQSTIQSQANDHASGHAVSHGGADHHHDPDAWAPEDGIERLFFTSFSNVLAGMAFGLLILAGMAYKGKGNILMGGLWGVAGYLTFFVAPTLGLHPEIPGMEAANLQGRQGWWLTTVALTAAGLGLIAFAHVSLKVAGVVLLVIPHVLGAPLPEVAAGASHFFHPDPQAVLALEALAADFLQATAIANAVFWLVLGLSCGYVVNKFGIIKAAQE